MWKSLLESHHQKSHFAATFDCRFKVVLANSDKRGWLLLLVWIYRYISHQSSHYFSMGGGGWRVCFSSN